MNVLKRKGIFDQIFENNPIAMFLIDFSENYLITESNQAAQELFGWTGYNLEPVTMNDIIPVEMKKTYRGLFEKLKTEKVVTAETYSKTKDGKVFPVKIHINTFWIDNKREAVITMENISEHKQVQEELLKLVQAVEQSPESIIITNLDSEIEYVNQAFVYQTGYIKEEMLNKNPRILQSGKTPPATYKEMWEELIHDRSWKGEFCNRRKDGTEFFEFVHISPIHQTNGPISHYVAVKEDITEKKKIAWELDQYRYQLEEKVRIRTKQLFDAWERAEAANKAKSSFLANMSHEIRTPMNTIIGLSHLMRRNNPSPDQLEYLKKINFAADHLLTIINDILDLSKIEAGKMTIEETDFSLNSILNQITAMLRVQVEQKDLKMIVERNNVPDWLNGDPTRLRQAILNFASNAVKFTEQGEICIKAEKLEDSDDNFLVRFEVQDSGIGIESSKQSHLFKAFEQVDKSTTRKYGGTGLGLAITGKIAKLMNGDAGVISEPGRGSTFWFTARLSPGRGVVPLDDPIEIPDSETDIYKYYRDSRILLVEDNLINMEVARELLSGAGLNVDTAGNGKIALDKIKTGIYDLVLMDVQMPELDGLEATRLVRSIDGFSDLPILAMTANIFKENRQECLDAGMNDFVSKPVDPDNLFSTIIKWLPDSLNKKIKSPEAEKTDLIAKLEKINGIEPEKGLRNVLGNVTVYTRLLRQFDSIHADDIGIVELQLEKGMHYEALRIIHTLKGAAGTLGITGIENSARIIEKQKGENINTPADNIRAIQTDLHKILNHTDDSVIEEKKNPENRDQAVKELNHIKQLLKTDDSAALSVFIKSEILLKQTFGPVVDKMEKQIEAFDYPGAIITIDSIYKGILYE